METQYNCATMPCGEVAANYAQEFYGQQPGVAANISNPGCEKTIWPKSYLDGVVTNVTSLTLSRERFKPEIAAMQGLISNKGTDDVSVQFRDGVGNILGTVTACAEEDTNFQILGAVNAVGPFPAFIITATGGDVTITGLIKGYTLNQIVQCQ